MSQPPVPGHPPPPQPPLTYGGYGGELQHYQPPGSSQTFAPAASPGPIPAGPPANYPAGYPAPAPPNAWPQPALPAAAAHYPPVLRVPQPPQRPAAVTLAATLAVTASLQLIGGVTLLWLLAVTAGQQLGTSGADGVVFHIFNRFDDRMVTGLAWPLYLFPLASVVLGLLLPTRRPWARLAFTLLGAASVAWMAWLFRSDLAWLLVPGGYVAFCVALPWMTASRRWYAWQPPSDGHPQPR